MLNFLLMGGHDLTSVETTALEKLCCYLALILKLQRQLHYK